jgi:hypothetical protein
MQHHTVIRWFIAVHNPTDIIGSTMAETPEEAWQEFWGPLPEGTAVAASMWAVPVLMSWHVPTGEEVLPSPRPFNPMTDYRPTLP